MQEKSISIYDLINFSAIRDKHQIYVCVRFKQVYDEGKIGFFIELV